MDLGEIISREALLPANEPVLAGGGVFEIKNFFTDDFARRLAGSLAADRVRMVFARTPPGATSDDVIGYAPHVSEDEYDSLPARDRFLRFGQIDSEPLSDGAAGPDAALAAAALGGAEFRSGLAAASGYVLAESHFDVHVMRRGDFIGWHTDARGGRKVGLLVYLTESRGEGNGGILEPRQPDGLQRFVPEFNRALIFGVDALAVHRVTPVASDTPRLTVGMWFL
jgi:hypothetical protein